MKIYVAADADADANVTAKFLCRTEMCMSASHLLYGAKLKPQYGSSAPGLKVTCYKLDFRHRTRIIALSYKCNAICLKPLCKGQVYEKVTGCHRQTSKHDCPHPSICHHQASSPKNSPFPLSLLLCKEDARLRSASWANKVGQRSICRARRNGDAAR